MLPRTMLQRNFNPCRVLCDPSTCLPLHTTNSICMYLLYFVVWQLQSKSTPFFIFISLMLSQNILRSPHHNKLLSEMKAKSSHVKRNSLSLKFSTHSLKTSLKGFLVVNLSVLKEATICLCRGLWGDVFSRVL